MSDPPVLNDPTKLKPRLTIVESINYQTPRKQPKGIASGFSRNLETHEQVYERELVATGEWQPLIDNRCWIEVCSLVHIANEEGKYLSTNPTDEEREATAAKVLELSYDPSQVDNWLIPPGETFRGTPSVPKALFIRSQSGEAQFTLHVFPR